MSTKAGCSSVKGTAVRKLSTVLDSSLVASSWAFINEIASPLIVQAIQATFESWDWAWRKAEASSTSTGRWALAMAAAGGCGGAVSTAQGLSRALYTRYVQNLAFFWLFICEKTGFPIELRRVLVKG